MDEATKKKLVELAIKAAERAYAPYSKFRVGSALIDDRGTIYTGCNVENASYGLCVCAERTALVKAVSEGAGKVLGMAIVTLDAPSYCSPCGACRQIMHELAKDALILIASRDGTWQESTMDKLLPGAFEL